MNKRSAFAAAGLLLVVVAAVIMLFSVRAEKEKKKPQEKPLSTFSEQPNGIQTYTFRVDNALLYPDKDVTVLPEGLSEPDSVFESESCAAQGIAKLYAWRDFEVLTYPDKTRDKIQYIYLKTDAVQTMEGADLSTPREKIEAVYGKGAEGSDETKLVYPCGTMRLVFVFGEDDYPVSIEYRSGVMQ